jgi:hypothetical protein
VLGAVGLRRDGERGVYKELRGAVEGYFRILPSYWKKLG